MLRLLRSCVTWLVRACPLQEAAEVTSGCPASQRKARSGGGAEGREVVTAMSQQRRYARHRRPERKRKVLIWFFIWREMFLAV